MEYNLLVIIKSDSVDGVLGYGLIWWCLILVVVDPYCFPIDDNVGGRLDDFFFELSIGVVVVEQLFGLSLCGDYSD